MDKILLFAPAGQYLTADNELDTERLDRIAAGIRAKGFALAELPSVRSAETRFAGSDEVRLADAVAALADDSADLALALRVCSRSFPGTNWVRAGRCLRATPT